MRAAVLIVWALALSGEGLRSASSVAGAVSAATGETVRCEGVHAEHGKGAWIDAQVDDDYCDCEAGEDEPGTAACSHLTVTSAGAEAQAVDHTHTASALPCRLLHRGVRWCD